MKANIIDPRFGPAINETELVVPQYYNHGTWLATFAEKTKGLPDTDYYNNELIDTNFSKVSNKLVPGKKYKAKLFPILENNVPSEDCLSILKGQGATLVGAQGIMLLQHLNKGFFPIDKRTVSFDEKNRLWKDAKGYHRVPFVDRDSGGGWVFSLGCFEGQWLDIRCLVCFCDC